MKKQTKMISANQHNTAMIAGAGIVLGFFLPWANIFIGTVSGYSLIELGLEMDNPKMFLVAIPMLIGLIALFTGWTHGNPTNYGMPSICVILYLVFKLITAIEKTGADAGMWRELSSNSSDILELLSQVVGIGFHLTWIGLVVLAWIGMPKFNTSATPKEVDHTERNAEKATEKEVARIMAEKSQPQSTEEAESK